jgi:crotonobetainyl-CoA:carnitine CoA-transferase CaiB-like acyl-CoA transferase
VGDGADPESTYFLAANRNKESVVADLKSSAGRELLAGLIGRADVLLENYRPGLLARLGFPVDLLHELNPRLVIGSITGFGHDGPEAERAGYDQIAQGESGLMSVTGDDPDRPMKVGVPISDLLAGMYLAYGVLAALHERETTGRGRVVRTSLLASSVGPTPTSARSGRSRTRCPSPSVTVTGRSRPTACSVRPTRRSRCAAAASRCGVRSLPSWTSTRPTRDSPRTPTASPTPPP